jgi:PHD/YefM family antitoxin component YafN of YafNO toxin-antitoxin module
MIELHPELLRKNGQIEFVVLPYEEYEALQELLADYQDLLDLRAAKDGEGDKPTTSLSEVKNKLERMQ